MQPTRPAPATQIVSGVVPGMARGVLVSFWSALAADISLKQERSAFSHDQERYPPPSGSASTQLAQQSRADPGVIQVMIQRRSR